MIKRIKQLYRKVKNSLKERYEKVKAKVTSHPAYVKFVRKRDKLADRMLVVLLAFFDVISPVLTFLCINKVDPDKKANS